MRPTQLSDDELNLITDQSDIIILEIIKGMSIEELRSFDVYIAVDFKHYCKTQCKWLEAERYLIEQRPECNHAITEDELIADMLENNNPERFRTFYVLKYPHRVRRDIYK